jgi:hypothetical protein
LWPKNLSGLFQHEFLPGELIRDLSFSGPQIPVRLCPRKNEVRPLNVRYINNMKNILTVCAALTLLVGCKADEKFLAQSADSPLIATRSNGEICTNNLPQELHSEINTWLIQNNKNWTPDFNSYALITVVENDFIRLNILKDGLILSIKKDDAWPQYSKPIKPIHLKWKTEIEKLSEPIK